MTTSTVVPSALQLVDGREESSYNSLKRSSSSSFGSESPDSPSPGKTARKPMRKRAKTQEEKEERAQERIMRNRAAAQVSRERKREHMVLLEQENEQLHLQIKTLSGDNATLRNTVDSLSQRLENMERMMALFTAPGTTSIIDHNTASTSPVNLDNAPPQDECSATSQTFYCPTPPGTIRPQDLISNPSTPFMETLDSRNPAVIVNGPQRRISMKFPWNISSHSPIYRQMETILSFWTTILRELTSRAFLSRTMTMLLMQCATFQKRSLPRALDHWRLSATGLDAQAWSTDGEAHAPTSNDHVEASKDFFGVEDDGFSGKPSNKYL